MSDEADNALDPMPHFGLTSYATDERHVARIIVADEEVAAILDGLTLSESRVTIPLLRLAMAEVCHQAHTDLAEEGDWADDPKCADDIEVLFSRLPLAARIHKYLMVVRDSEGMEIAEREGWDAEIREMFVGKIKGIPIDGDERDVLVHFVKIARKETDEKGKAELDAILSDTGSKKNTGEPAFLSTLPMPQLVEWMRRLVHMSLKAREQAEYRDEDKKAAKAAKRRWKILREGVWFRLGRAVNAGPNGGEG